MKKHALFAMPPALLLAILSPSARGGDVTIQFSGHVFRASPAAQVTFSVDDPFSGQFTYDDAEPDGAPVFGSTGQYGLGLSEFTISFADSGGSTYYSETKTSGFAANNLEVSNGLSFDRVTVAINSGGLPNPPGLPAGRLQIDFSDLGTPHAATTLDTIALPSPIPFASLSNQTGTWQLNTFITTIGLEVTSVSIVAALPDPEWTNISVDAGGQVDLTLETVSGQQYQIDHSPNGTIWTPWQTVTATGTSTPLIDNPPGGVTVRLYRATRL